MITLDGRGPAVGLGARSTLTRVSTPDRHVVDGRTVLNRAAICTSFGVSVSTAERWWRERATNGHPPVAYREGRRQWWDEQAMRAFVDAGRGEPDQLTHENRTLLGRAALARRYRVSEQYLTDLYHRRAVRAAGQACPDAATGRPVTHDHGPDCGGCPSGQRAGHSVTVNDHGRRPFGIRRPGVAI